METHNSAMITTDSKGIEVIGHKTEWTCLMAIKHGNIPLIKLCLPYVNSCENLYTAAVASGSRLIYKIILPRLEGLTRSTKDILRLSVRDLDFMLFLCGNYHPPNTEPVLVKDYILTDNNYKEIRFILRSHFDFNISLIGIERNMEGKFFRLLSHGGIVGNPNDKFHISDNFIRDCVELGYNRILKELNLETLPSGLIITREQYYILPYVPVNKIILHLDSWRLVEEVIGDFPGEFEFPDESTFDIISELYDTYGRKHALLRIVKSWEKYVGDFESKSEEFMMLLSSKQHYPYFFLVMSGLSVLITEWFKKYGMFGDVEFLVGFMRKIRVTEIYTHKGDPNRSKKVKILEGEFPHLKFIAYKGELQDK